MKVYQNYFREENDANQCNLVHLLVDIDVYLLNSNYSESEKIRHCTHFTVLCCICGPCRKLGIVSSLYTEKNLFQLTALVRT
jgi:hypothetical protein